MREAGGTKKRQDMLEQENEKRLNKLLSELGVCSRREADRRIEAGEVFVDGRSAVCGQKVHPGQQIIYKGQEVGEKPEPVLLMVNKPRGIVCTSQKKEKNNIVDFVHYPQRVYPVGRLDKESRGLILMTNQGDLVNRIMKESTYHEKEYLVWVDKTVTSEFVKKMSQGIYLPEFGRTTRTCRVKKESRNLFSIILTQGWNRQIRRMCEACGYRVRDLQRIRIMNLKLGDLAEGKVRRVSKEEYLGLMRELDCAGGKEQHESGRKDPHAAGKDRIS